MKQTSVKGLPSTTCLFGTTGSALEFLPSDGHAVSSPPIGSNFIFCPNFLELLNVNSGLKCKFDLIIKNSIQ